MELGSVVVDINSDEELDEFGVDKTLDESYYLINQWPNDKEWVDINNVVDEYLNYMENCGSLKVKSSAAQNYLDDDCIVLDGDPDKPIAVNDNERNGGNGYDDLCIVGQKGQVACRDFPHSRHLCANFPFNNTSHEKHCRLCHCYVCDSPAPCIYWGNGVSLSNHCHATDKNEIWKSQRKSFKRITTKTLSPQNLPILQPPVPSPIQNPRSILHQIPAHRQVQPANATPSRPYFATITNTAYLPSQRHKQNMLNRAQTPLTGTQSHHHTNSSALTCSIIQSHSKFKRVGTPGCGLVSSSMNRASHTGFNPYQMHLFVPHRPLNPIVTMQTPQIAAVAASDTRKWQDIVAGLAAELGVSDYITPPCYTSPSYLIQSQYTNSNQGNQPYYASPSYLIQSQYNNSNQGNQPYYASPSHLIQSQDNSLNQGMALRSDLGRTVISSNSLDSTAGQNVNMGTACVNGKWNGQQEVDSTLVLYEPEASWSSMANV